MNVCVERRNQGQSVAIELYICVRPITGNLSHIEISQSAQFVVLCCKCRYHVFCTSSIPPTAPHRDRSDLIIVANHIQLKITQ